jgi:hypothetical protein
MTGQWKNPLNLEPVVRPPGTILMSYPFGFSDEYKGFLARSVILPVFLFITALYVAASRRQMSRTEHLDLAAVALILASLPCFYHFEAVAGVNSPTYWGLVDSFLAAVAALAFATGYRAVQCRSWQLLALASLLTGLCLMIKPAGVIVAPVIVTVLIITKIFSDLNRPGGRLFSIQLFSFVITASAGTGLMLIAAFKSAYLSSETLKYGNTAMSVLRNDFASGISIARLEYALYPAFGLNIIALGLATAICCNPGFRGSHSAARFPLDICQHAKAPAGHSCFGRGGVLLAGVCRTVAGQIFLSLCVCQLDALSNFLTRRHSREDRAVHTTSDLWFRRNAIRKPHGDVVFL